MSKSRLQVVGSHRCAGFKGPRAGEWLASHGLQVPVEPNSWTWSVGAGTSKSVVLARLGYSEFFLGEDAGAELISDLAEGSRENCRDVFPVMREDAHFVLSGAEASDVLAQVCNVDFHRFPPSERRVVMALMIGVSVLVIPQDSHGESKFRIWCDPSFKYYIKESLKAVVVDCGGVYEEVR